MLNIQQSPEGACKALFSRRGTTSKVARALGITAGAVSQWDRVPVDRVAAVSEITGIPAAELRPDLAETFAPAKRGKAAPAEPATT